MKQAILGYRKSPLLAASILLGGLWLAGCDERVEIIRNRDIPVLKHQTWRGGQRPPKRKPGMSGQLFRGT